MHYPACQDYRNRNSLSELSICYSAVSLNYHLQDQSYKNNLQLSLLLLMSDTPGCHSQ